MNPQNPQDPQNQQYQPYQPVETPPPTPMGNPFASSDVNFKPHHDRPCISVGKLLKRLSAVVVAFGMIAGIGYGVNYFLGIADREQQAYNARLAEAVGAETEEAIYIGTGSNILEVKAPQVIQACPAGFEEVGENCQKTELTSVSAAQYSCPVGYTQGGSGAGTSCLRTEGGTKESIPATVQSTCEAGYTLSGSGCVKTEVAPFVVTYSCPAGFQKSQLATTVVTCSKQETINGTLRVSCPSGYSPSGSSCIRSQPASSNTTYSCPAGYSVVGSSCTKAPIISCPANHIVQGGLCVHQYTSSSQSCPAGYAKSAVNRSIICRSERPLIRSCPGANRVGTGAQMYCSLAGTPSTTYSCPANFSRSGTTCTQSAAQITSCDANFAKSGSTCIRINIVNQDATKQNTCPATYSIANTNCQREARVAAIQALSCAAGLTREGNNCTKINGGRTVTASPNISISCGAGFTQVGSGNAATCEKRELLSSPRVEQQTCEEGWSKRIIGTTIDCVRTA